jgi:hypothetical protein
MVSLCQFILLELITDPRKAKDSPRTALTPKDKNQFPAPSALSPSKAGPCSPDLQESTLQFVPRKRTNTNQVITPKKLLRQSTLNRHAQTHSLLVQTLGAASPEKKERKPRKSLRKSGRKSILVQLGEEAVINAPTEVSVGVTASAPGSNQFQLSFTASDTQQIESQNTPQRSIESVETQDTEPRSLRRSTRSTRSSSVFTFEAPKNSPTVTRSMSPVKMLFDEFLAEDSEEPPTFMSPVKSSWGVVEEAAASEDTPSEKEDAEIIIDSEVDEDIFDAEDDVDETVNQSLCTLDIIPADTTLEATSMLELESIETAANSGEPNLPELLRVTMIEGSEQVEDVSEDAIPSDEPESLHSDPIDGTALDLALEAQIVNEILMSPKKPVAVNYEDAVDSEEPASDLVDVSSDFSNDAAPESESYEEITFSPSVVTADVPINVEPLTTDIVESLSCNVTSSAYDHDDTDMLRNFLTRVKANKAAKEPPRRKRSLPHSPLPSQIGSTENPLSPSPLDIDLTEGSPAKRRRPNPDDLTEPRSIRRSSRTRLPVAKPPPGAPSFIPVRRLGQDQDTTLTLKRNDDKELAALTRVNTRKNKGSALLATEVLKKKADEKEDPAMRQRLLKEVFDERKQKEGAKDKGTGKGLSVRWAEELVHYQTFERGKLTRKPVEIEEKEEMKEVKVKGVGFAPAPVEKEKSEEKRAASVRVGVQSKIALGMAVNGTPAPKRKMRGRM